MTGTFANSANFLTAFWVKIQEVCISFFFFATSSLMIVGTSTHLWITKCVNETMHDIWIS